ncbi:solute carrier family 16 member 6a [Gouania willdenowi]|uniref:Monocarboxylate transporter 7 n=1 Tax=Gouania willdenowi TaxID=441366 RepID=A0A8C5G9A2_GOUWI|nr:monocarboxylate transporter 7-like [Gouania willdenowi]
MAICLEKLKQFWKPNVYTKAPDGGWGWVIAVAFFLVEAFTYGTIKIFGIFLQDLMEEFTETNSRVSWIVSICVFVMTFNAPISSVMTNRFGFQLVVMVGGLLISTGTTVTSFTTSVNQMYLTYGIVAGFGYCLSFLPTVTLLSQYFDHRRSLVTAIASTGESLAIFALAPAFSAMKSHLGWRHTMAVMGALQGIIIICGALLRRIVIQPKGNQLTETDQLTRTDQRSTKDPEDLSAQETTENPKMQNSVQNQNSAKNTFYSLDNELTTDSVSTGDSGIQSVKEKPTGSPEENTFLNHEAKSETNQSTPRNGTAEVKINYEEENQVMKEERRKEKPSKLKFKLLDFSILKECTFILYSLFGLFATLGFFAPQLYIIDLSVSRGVERDQASYMLSIMAVAEIVGRLSVGWIMTRKALRTKKLLVMLACVVLMTLDLLAFTLVTEFYGLAVCSAVYGMLMGTLACTHIPMLAEDDVVGIERMSSAAGVYVFIQSFAGLAGPPLGGVLVDVSQNYGSAFYSCAAGMGISAIFLGLVKPAKKGLLCRRRRTDTPRDAHESNGVLEEQNKD